MSKKFVLIPLQTFMDLCSKVKRSGDTITGVVKDYESSKQKDSREEKRKKRKRRRNSSESSDSSQSSRSSSLI